MNLTPSQRELLVLYRGEWAGYLLESRKPDRPDRPNPVIRCACGCGRELGQYDAKGRPRRFARGHGNTSRERKRTEAAA